MKKLLFFWNELKATFWFVPALIMIISIILSIALVYLDGITDFRHIEWFEFFLVNNPDSARTILSTISGAMIGVAGTVFSVTLVALTLASSQFGSRMIKNFMYVRLNQIVLGLYVSTYLYCLLVLSAIKNSEGYTFIPSISILLAIFATIVNILLLILFIHRIAISIQADSIIYEISSIMSKQLKTLYPDKLTEEEDEIDEKTVDYLLSSYHIITSIKSPKDGYLQYVDYNSLIKKNVKNDLVFVLNYRSGKHLVEDLEIGKLYSKNKIEKEDIEDVLDHFVIGNKKTTQQDIEFSVHQLVEIALRALSPGINDPYTAISCIDNLAALMCSLTKVKFPAKYSFDEENNLRLVSKTLDFEGVLDAAFNQIRQFSEGSPAIIIRLMEALINISIFANKEDQKQAITKHAEMILRIGKQTINEENDFKDLEKRAKQLLNLKK